MIQLDLFFFSSLVNEMLECDDLRQFIFDNRGVIENLLWTMMENDNIQFHFGGQQYFRGDVLPTRFTDQNSVGANGENDHTSLLKLLRNSLTHSIDLGSTARQNIANGQFRNTWTTGIRFHLFEVLKTLLQLNTGVNIFAVSRANW